MEDEINVRFYVDAIVKRWRLIGLITLTAMVVAGVVSFLMPPFYTAEATVVVVRLRSEVAFEPKFRTVSEEELIQLGGDLTARRQVVLKALAESSVVAGRVLSELGRLLDPEEQDIESLLEMVRIESEGDIITMEATANAPQKAAAIANAWGQAYEEYANEMYHPAPASTVIQSQLEEAWTNYLQAQQALKAFKGDNRLDVLEREIKARQSLMDNYKQAQTQAQTAVFNKQIENHLRILDSYYDNLNRLEQLIADAKALRIQLAGTGTSSAAETGNSLAVIFMRASAFTKSAQFPVQFQIPMGEASRGPGEAREQLGDIEALLTVLETARREARAKIDELSTEVLISKMFDVEPPPGDPLTVLIAKHAQEVLQLEADQEEQQARFREFTQDRDLAWETYVTLARKSAELAVAAQTSDTEVKFAIPAIEPAKPAGPRKLVNIVLGGMLGLIFSIIGAMVLGHGQQPVPNKS